MFVCVNCEKLECHCLATSCSQRDEPPPPPPESDFDLDSLLSDLTSFNPSAAVAARNPPPPPPRQDRLHPSPSHSSHSSHSTPVHNHHSTPTPPRYVLHSLSQQCVYHCNPSTPGHAPPPPTRAKPQMLRSNTEEMMEDNPHPPTHPRSHSITSPSHERHIEQGTA